MDHRSGLHLLWPKLDLNGFHKRIGIFEIPNRQDFTPFEFSHDSEQHILLIDRRIKELPGLYNKATPGLIGIIGTTNCAKASCRTKSSDRGGEILASIILPPSMMTSFL